MCVVAFGFQTINVRCIFRQVRFRDPWETVSLKGFFFFSDILFFFFFFFFRYSCRRGLSSNQDTTSNIIDTHITLPIFFVDILSVSFKTFFFYQIFNGELPLFFYQINFLSLFANILSFFSKEYKIHILIFFFFFRYSFFFYQILVYLFYRYSF